ASIAQLAPLLRGDLDCIVGKALNKDAVQRYASVATLAEDIERHLRGEVVLAQPDSRWYRLKKFTARNKLLIGAGSSVAVAVVAAMVVSIWQGRIANQEKRNAEEVRKFLVEAISSADPNRTGGKDVNVKSMLDAAAKRVETSFGNQPETGLELTALLGELYATLGDNAAAQKQFRNAVAQSQKNGKAGTLPYADLVDQAVKVELRNNASKEARSLAESVMTDTRRVSGESSLAFATALAAMANVERHDGKDKEAIPFAERSLEITRALAGSNHADTLDRLDDLGVAYTDARLDEKALPIFEELRRRDAELNLRSKSIQLNAWASLAFTYIRLMRFGDAIREYTALVPAYETLLGKNHPKVRLNMQRFASILGKVGEFDKARRLFDEALSRGPAIPTTDRSQLDAMNMRGVFLSAMHLHEAALADTSAPANHFRQSPNLPAGPRLYYELVHGQTLLRAGRPEEAIKVLDRVKSDREEKQNVLSFEYAATLTSLSCAHRMLGQFEQAQALLSRAQTWLDTNKIPADDQRALREGLQRVRLRGALTAAHRSWAIRRWAP
ncbi:MAG: tetratricopeptide repeat protein, partial [Usitatibacteraceae bacterium]